MIACRRDRFMRAVAAIFLLMITVALWDITAARAAEEGTGWEVFAQAYPTNLAPGHGGTIQIDLMNIGAKQSYGPITVTDVLPPGVIATAVGGMNIHGNTVESREEEEKEKIKEKITENGVEKEVERERGGSRWDCGGVGTVEVTCTSNPTYLQPLPTGAGQDFQSIERIAIAVEAGAGALEGSFPNRVTAAGGGASGMTATSDAVTLSALEPMFGFSGWGVWFSNAAGTIDTQAGSHPYETTFALGFNELADGRLAGGEARNVEAELPSGFFGEPNAIPQCTRQQLDAQACPADTEIGNDTVMKTTEGGGGPSGYLLLPVYNVVPPQGVADQLGVLIAGKQVFFDSGPRGYGDYRLVTNIDNVPAVRLDTNILTLWGVPPEASHDPARVAYGYASDPESVEYGEKGGPSAAPPRPFLTLPTSCAGPQEFVIHVRGTWEDKSTEREASVPTQNALEQPVGFTGCSNLAFDPSIAAVPDTSAADTPTGLSVNVRMPQEALRSPKGLVEATIKNATVTLPEGLVINPGQAAGLAACGEAQARLHEEGPQSCPGASKVGTVKIKTPLLEGELESELEGDVYVLAQSNGGPGEPLNLQSKPPTLQLLIAATGDGVHLKLVANVQLNETTGHLTSILTETPALPFTSFELAFSGGAQAALTTPTNCGTYTTTSDFTPWTSPFAPELFPSSSFQISSGPNGTPCPSSPLPFSPSLIAGSTTDQAGSYTNFSLLLQRGDGQQRIERLQFKAPAGLSGMIGAVTQCPEPQASEGKCPEGSKIGYATVASGPGPYPLVIPQPGDPESPIFLTGPYEGAPFGLSIVTHVLAGPFNLGTIITRAKIEIDPLTAQITVTTQPLPQVVAGVPTDLRLINSVVDRSGFMFNPTNCDVSSFSGTAWGTPPPGVSGPGASAPIASRFRVGSCQGLKFKPTFEVSTSAHTSRLDGASLHVSLAMPNEGGLGTEANVRKVKVSLPKKLPTPLKTLQKACSEETFAADPANCPPASRVAQAKVSTPVLPGGLSGPAYFVSHGGARYPELIIVLTGANGVTVQVHGETFISKMGITTGTFSTTPDVPFTNFELTFPRDQYPAFTADGNLCKGTLVMPTEMVGQNGYVINQRTKITVAGCPRKTAHRKKTHRKRAKGQDKGRRSARGSIIK